MLHLISIRAPLIYAGFKYTYTLFLFTTPYIGYRFMRHPGYFAMLISVPASALAIRSPWGPKFLGTQVFAGSKQQ
jgi:protein-S-isoprenylcysteine O-methyltransferase Ste14